MSTAKAREVSKHQIAYENDLFRIERCELALKGCESLTFLGKSWLAYFIGLVRLNYNQIKASIGALNHAQRIAVGYSNSRSSAFRALKELEREGFIRRHKLRVGRDCRGVVIDLHHERFTYWTQQRNFNVLPLRTKSQVSPCVSTRHPDDVTNNSSMLGTTDPEALVSNSSGSNKHTNNKTPETKLDLWVDPRLYTVGLLLKKSPRPDAKLVYKRARAALADQISCPGLELDHWTPERWYSMTHNEREYHALHTLLPAITGAKKMPKIDRRVSKVVEHISKSCERPAELDEAVYKLIGKPEDAPAEQPAKELVSTLDEDELTVLKAANSRLKYKRDREQGDKKAEHEDHKQQIEKSLE